MTLIVTSIQNHYISFIQNKLVTNIFVKHKKEENYFTKITLYTVIFYYEKVENCI